MLPEKKEGFIERWQFCVEPSVRNQFKYEAAAAIRETVEEEREACAKMCDKGVEWSPPHQPGVRTIIRESCAKLARYIRNRSNTPAVTDAGQ